MCDEPDNCPCKSLSQSDGKGVVTWKLIRVLRRDLRKHGDIEGAQKTNKELRALLLESYQHLQYFLSL